MQREEEGNNKEADLEVTDSATGAASSKISDAPQSQNSRGSNREMRGDSNQAPSAKTRTASDPSSAYDVGYGKPPKHARFAKGQSGNLNGRPRGVLNFATVLERTLREKVVINENGRRKVITKLQAAIAQLVNKAGSGDSHAIRYLCQLVISAEEKSVTAEPTTQFSEADQKVMDNILKRFQQSSKGRHDGTESE